MKRMGSWILLTLLLVGTFSLAFDVRPARAAEVTVYIKSDGSVVPSDAPISTSDNVTYTFTGDISYPTYYGIVVQRNNTVIDGNGYTVQGNQTDYTYGLQFMVISNVTVKNVNVKNFYHGFTFYLCSNIVVSGNNATANTDGIFIQSSINSTIVSNNVSANSDCGIYLYTSNTTIITENNATANGNKGYCSSSLPITLFAGTMQRETATMASAFFIIERTLSSETTPKQTTILASACNIHTIVSLTETT